MYFVFPFLRGRPAVARRWLAPVTLALLLIAVLASASPLAAHAEAAGPRPGRDYRIAVRDMIHFQVYEEPEMLVAQRVTASGEIRLPLVGTVEVAGLSLREAEAKLRDLYVEGGFFVSPQVMLSLHEYTVRSVSVLGQVNKPAQVEFPPETRSIGLVQAITSAGGLTRLAKSDGIQVVRVDAAGREDRFTVDLNTYLGNRQGAPKPFELFPGDIVFVPERMF